MDLTLRNLLAIVEIRTKLVSLSTYLLGTLYAAWRGAQIELAPALLLFLALLCVDMATTAFNTFFDFYRRVDDQAHNREPDKVLVHSGVAPGQALIVAMVLYVVAALLGVSLALLTDGWMIVVGALGMIVGFLYNAGPLPISRTPAGELFAGGFLGGVLFALVAYVHLGFVDGKVVLASLPPMLMIAGILAANNACDIVGDRAAKRATVAVLVGPRLAGVYLILLVIAAFGVMIVDSVVGALPPAAMIAGAAGLAASAPILATLARRGYSHRTKRLTMISILRILLLFSAAFAAALGWPLLH